MNFWRNKILSKVLLSFVVLGIFLAPVGGVFKSGITKQSASAQVTQLVVLEPKINQGGVGAVVSVRVTGSLAPNEKIILYLKTKLDNLKEYDLTSLKIVDGVINGINIDYDFDKDTTYYLVAAIVGGQNIVQSEQISFKGSGSDFKNSDGPTGTGSTPVPKSSGEDYLECGFTNLRGCIASLFYLLWELSAQIARLAAHFLDWFIAYSIDSASYENNFIIKGWTIMRDVSNMFFIIALLVLAFRMILDIGRAHVKHTLSMIVMIALVINFSLFFTRVVVDASNILAHVFYNNITPIGPDGQPLDNGSNEKSITVGMVDKFKPQHLLNANVYHEDKYGWGIFVLTAVVLFFLTLYIAYMFFSVALLFLGRVAAIWIAMIFAPLAFISVVLPIQIPGISWKEWWGGFIKPVFMAPIFLFFLYLIVLFLDVSGGQISFNSGDEFFQRVMAVIIPFAILYMLISQAKELAKKYAGQAGEMAQKTGAMLGTLALGATTSGVAALSRKGLGGVTRSLSNREGTRDYFVQKDKFEKELTAWKKNTDPNKGAMPTWENFQKEKNLSYSLADKIGVYINQSQKHVGTVEHARHEVDEIKKEAGFGDISYENLSAPQLESIEKKFLNKKKSDLQGALIRGEEDLIEETKDKNGNVIKKSYKGKDDFEAQKRQEVIEAMQKEKDKYIESGDLTMEQKTKVIKKNVQQYNEKTKAFETVEVEETINVGDPVLTLTKKGAKTAENKLRKEFEELLKSNTKTLAKDKFAELRHEANEQIGLLQRTATGVTGGSHNIVNIDKIPGPDDKRDSFGTRATGFIIKTVASGVREAMKSQKVDVKSNFKDTVTEALKRGPGNIKMPSGGGDKHGGGHTSGAVHDSHGHGGH